jgi:hypothetical protein
MLAGALRRDRSLGGAQRKGFAAVGGGEMAEAGQRRDHEADALLDLFALREPFLLLFRGAAFVPKPRLLDA